MPETQVGQLDHVQDKYSNADNMCLLVNIQVQEMKSIEVKVNYNSLPISKVLSWTYKVRLNKSTGLYPTLRKYRQYLLPMHVSR